LAEYAYVLRPGGIAYTATDVEELNDWMVLHFEEHPMFERIPETELQDDPCVKAILQDSEEAKKVEKANKKKFYAVFRRKDI
jgi:tRNA (guanine-N7-)-methyltransferase